MYTLEAVEQRKNLKELENIKTVINRVHNFTFQNCNNFLVY